MYCAYSFGAQHGGNPFNSLHFHLNEIKAQPKQYKRREVIKWTRNLATNHLNAQFLRSLYSRPATQQLSSFLSLFLLQLESPPLVGITTVLCLELWRQRRRRILLFAALPSLYQFNNPPFHPPPKEYIGIMSIFVLHSQQLSLCSLCYLYPQMHDRVKCSGLDPNYPKLSRIDSKTEIQIIQPLEDFSENVEIFFCIWNVSFAMYDGRMIKEH